MSNVNEWMIEAHEILDYVILVDQYGKLLGVVDEFE